MKLQCDDDIYVTVKLVRSYIAKPSKYMEDYGFTGQDISYLISQRENKLTIYNIAGSADSASCK